MQLWYGAFSLEADTVVCKTRIETVLNAAGIPITRKTYMLVTGDLLVDTSAPDYQVNLTDKENQFKTALSIPYRDLVLKTDGGTNSATLLTNANTLSGVIITRGPDFMGDKAQAEYATRRQFAFEAMVEVVVNGQQNSLVSFTEALEFSGGGPVHIMARAINGPPQRQMTWPQTEYVVRQSGSAVGLLVEPRVPPPKFPTFLKEAPTIRRSGPERIGSHYRNFGVSWSYMFESARPLVAAPTLWIG